MTSDEVAHLMCTFRAATDPTWVRFEVVHLVYMFGDANDPTRDRFEVANLVLDNATQVCNCCQMCIPHIFQDIEKADEVRTVLKDLWDLRQAKLR